MEKIVENKIKIQIDNEDFIANILHDIKSPLYSIKIGLSNHLDTELSRDIFETTLNTINYIENFLTNYNFKIGKFENKIETCDIKKCIIQKLENLKYLFTNKNIYVDFKYNNEDYKVNSIPIFISSIIGNLVSNIAFHAKENELAKIEIYKKNNQIIASFENKYSNENHNFNLGLDFCQRLSRECKIETKFLKSETDVKVYLKIPNLINC